LASEVAKLASLVGNHLI